MSTVKKWKVRLLHHVGKMAEQGISLAEILNSLKAPCKNCRTIGAVEEKGYNIQCKVCGFVYAVRALHG